MKHYTYNGKTTDTLPDPCAGCSPMTESLFVELGGTITDDGEPTPEESFAVVCAQFRALCDEIGCFIGDSSFMGGFDEYASFASSTAYLTDPVTGNGLAIRWSALNELCKYKGAKAGYGQPEWWYRCWELAEEQTGA